MFFVRENETLYLNSFEYNSCLIIKELSKIVLENGGRIKKGKGGYIVNRAVTEHIRKNSETIKQISAKTEAQKEYVNKLSKELEDLQKINNEPVYVENTNYIFFVYQNHLYTYSMNDNPFMEFYYSKVPVIDGKYSRDYYIENDKKEWFYDCLFDYECTEAETKEAAKFIFDMLINAPLSQKYVDTKRTIVSNIYDDGYHYENVRKPERFEAIKF